MATRTGTTPSFFKHLPRGRWALVVAAFLLGLLLFALVWLAGRRHDSASVPGPVTSVRKKTRVVTTAAMVQPRKMDPALKRTVQVGRSLPVSGSHCAMRQG